MNKAREKKFSDQVRDAIESSGRTRYRIAKETGVAAETLSRFISGERGLSTAALDAIAGYLGWSLSVPAQPATKTAKPKALNRKDA
jgi:transcriptional regulator with XRE-family HTH domain